MASVTIRKSIPYDGVVACSAGDHSVPALFDQQRALVAWPRAARARDTRGLRPKDIDGFAVSSFTVGPDTAVGLTQHFGLSPRWLDHIPFGGASGIVALRRAARAVQAGDAEISSPASLPIPIMSIHSARRCRRSRALPRTPSIRTGLAAPTRRSR